MNKQARQTLIAHLTEAIQAAHLATAHIPDQGTCNFDGVAIPCRRSAKFEEEARDAGISLFRYGRRYIVSPKTNGQAGRRTAAAQHLFKALGALGIECGMWYQMD